MLLQVLLLKSGLHNRRAYGSVDQMYIVAFQQFQFCLHADTIVLLAPPPYSETCSLRSQLDNASLCRICHLELRDVRDENCSTWHSLLSIAVIL